MVFPSVFLEVLYNMQHLHTTSCFFGQFDNKKHVHGLWVLKDISSNSVSKVSYADALSCFHYLLVVEINFLITSQ